MGRLGDCHWEGPVATFIGDAALLGVGALIFDAELLRWGMYVCAGGWYAGISRPSQTSASVPGSLYHARHRVY